LGESPGRHDTLPDPGVFLVADEWNYRNWDVRAQDANAAKMKTITKSLAALVECPDLL
jgi:hypothetical protein